jgi:hypothetical protein
VYNTNTVTAKPTALNSSPAKEQDKAESKTKLSCRTLSARSKKLGEIAKERGITEKKL